VDREKVRILLEEVAAGALTPEQALSLIQSAVKERPRRPASRMCQGQRVIRNATI
jgi:hypothetical protein